MDEFKVKNIIIPNENGTKAMVNRLGSAEAFMASDWLVIAVWLLKQNMKVLPQEKNICSDMRMMRRKMRS